MCIRDRPNTLRLIPMNVSSTRLGGSMNSLATLQMNMAAIMKGILNKMAVSYTHLDVYQRQQICKGSD